MFLFVLLQLLTYGESRLGDELSVREREDRRMRTLLEIVSIANVLISMSNLCGRTHTNVEDFKAR